MDFTSPALMKSLNDAMTAHVEQLRAAGVFKSYDTPRRIEGEFDGPALTLKHHCMDEKNQPGELHHIGDCVYNIQEGDPRRYLSSSYVRAQTASFIMAIQNYVPFDLFQLFLNSYAHFLLNNENCFMENSANQATQQLERARLLGPTQRDMSGSYQDFRNRLCDSDLNRDILVCPELMTCMGIFHAAHGAYVNALWIAIDQNEMLTADERDNAEFVLKNPFHQFLEFGAFAFLPQLVIREYRHLTGQDDGSELGQPLDHEIMRVSIHDAWQQIFDHKALKVERAGTRTELIYQTCPAQSHFRRVRDAAVLEGLYDFVLSNKDALAPHSRLIMNGIKAAWPKIEENTRATRADRCPFNHG